MDKYTWQDKEDGVYAQDVNQCTYDHAIVYEGAAIDRLFEYESTNITPDEITALLVCNAALRADNDRMAGELEAGVPDAVKAAMANLIKARCRGGEYELAVAASALWQAWDEWNGLKGVL